MPAPVDEDERRLVEALTAAPDSKTAIHALGALMQRYKRLAYAVAYDTWRDRSLADDVFQETFVRMAVWLRARPGIEVKSFARLLSAFVRRTALELGRHNREVPTAPLEYWTTPTVVDRIYISELMGMLPDTSRAVLERSIFRGMSSREVAGELGLSAEQVRQVKHRALRMIRLRQERDLASLE
jgi:RNA polymerase sigma-70 factor (ECF subfamily)